MAYPTSKRRVFFLILLIGSSYGSYHEQYRVPLLSSKQYESYVFNNKEYLIQNLPVTWENAEILCRGQHNGSLAILDNRDKAEFLAEALSESQFYIDSLWVGARRQSAEDPSGYRWSQKVELRRTASDVLDSETEGENHGNHYPLWLNRTHVPVPEGGADCVALERVQHDQPVFLDLPCGLERPFACEREAKDISKVTEIKTVRCKTGLYRLYAARLEWEQAAAYCLLKNQTLANISTMKCLKKIGLAMLKTRPSVETAWIGARGELGRWLWTDTGASLFDLPAISDTTANQWPPMRDRSSIKQNGCLEVDRHASHAPVFMEARCDRRMHFICHQELSALRTPSAPPSDDLYYYVLVKQNMYWQHAYENCIKMNGTLAGIENIDMLIQLLLVMGENKDNPINHIWLSGRLNMSKDISTDVISYAWFNPKNGKRVPDQKTFGDNSANVYIPPWLDEDFTMDSSCLNLDRQDHLNGLVYGLPCDTPQPSICIIENDGVRSENKNRNGSLIILSVHEKTTSKPIATIQDATNIVSEDTVILPSQL